ncbi:hypothetical protein ACWD1Y_03190 [Streptomyces sp. NPDC002814]
MSTLEEHIDVGVSVDLDLEAGGNARELAAEVSDHGDERVMEWHPGTIREIFGGPKGFAQANAIERLVRDDLESFKEYVEREQ